MQQPVRSAAVRRGVILHLAALCSLLACATVWSRASTPVDPPGPSAAPALRIIWDQELLSIRSLAVDIRWASDRTIYVAWLNGVRELALDGLFTRLRELVPNPSPHGPFGFDMLATSPEHVVASSIFRTMAVRSNPTTRDGHVLLTWIPMGIIEGIDVSGGRLAILGNPEWERSPEGAIAWLGPVTDHPGKDLRPILIDAGGARSPQLVACSDLQLGGVRFLGDGSIFVVPGSQAGAHLYSPAGHLTRTWDTAGLGLDADIGCAGVDAVQQHQSMAISPPARAAFLNSHSVLDAILPLPQGPGLVIRRVAGGKVTWVLKVLRSNGTTESYQIPITGELPYDRLRGDVRGNRIVLLAGPHDSDIGKKSTRSTHVYVAELPEIAAPKTVEEGGQQ